MIMITIGPRACLRARFWNAVTTNGRHRFPVHAQKRRRAEYRLPRALQDRGRYCRERIMRPNRKVPKRPVGFKNEAVVHRVA